MKNIKTFLACLLSVVIALSSSIIYVTAANETIKNGPVDDYFYKDGQRLKAYQLVEYEGDYYFINDAHKIAKNKTIYLSERFVNGHYFKDGTSLKPGYYQFDEYGKMLPLNGPYGDYFYKNGVIAKAYQLIEYENNIYFIDDFDKIAKNKRVYLSHQFVCDFTYSDGTPLQPGYYYFDAEGKVSILNGIVGDYFYEKGVKLDAYQFIEYKGDFYFINDGSKIARDKKIYLYEKDVDGFTYEDGRTIKSGNYDFGSDGKMLINGPIGDYFYKDSVKLKAYQLVEFEGDFYFINDYNRIAKNKRIYLGERFVSGFTYKNGTPLEPGYYEFDADGRMIINGVIGENFFKDNVILKAYQLVEFEGNYYFINDSHKLAKSKRIYLSQIFVEGTDLKAGYYNFDENGKLIIE